MTPLFVFGTLRHVPLLQAVIGDITDISLTPARLQGFEVLAVADGAFPSITYGPDAVADGVLVQGLSKSAAARIDYYEAAFGYQLADVILEDGSAARAYFPELGKWSGQGLWSLDDWVRDWSALSVIAADEVMSYQDRKSPREIAAMFPMIQARAWSRLNARKSRHGALTLSGRVEVNSRKRAYANYFALDDYDLRHELFDGNRSPRVQRAVFLASDATLVLPYDPVRDRVLLVEQFRMGPLARGDRALWQLEPIAGRLDPGESPEAAARREAMEEAGLSLGRLEAVAETYCSPGNSSEFYYVYLGLADLPDHVAGIAGLEAEHEDIRSHILKFDRLMAMCADMQIANAPLVMASYWLAHHRDRLRREAGVLN